MKKILMTLAAVLCCAMATNVFTSCNSEVTGDFTYCVVTSDDTAAYTTYWSSGAEKTVLEEVEKVATKLPVGTNAYLINGRESECDKKIKAAVDAGMDKVEAKAGYGSVFDLSGVTVVIESVKSSTEVIYSRKFK